MPAKDDGVGQVVGGGRRSRVERVPAGIDRELQRADVHIGRRTVEASGDRVIVNVDAVHNPGAITNRHRDDAPLLGIDRVGVAESFDVDVDLDEAIDLQVVDPIAGAGR